MSIQTKAVADGIFLTQDQIGEAPPVVQSWLREQMLADEAIAQDALDVDDGLAICSPHEIKLLLRALGDDYLTCQVFFELGCNLYHPQTGERRPNRLRTQEFLHHTDIGDVDRLHDAIDAVNEAFRDLRGDPDITVARYNGLNGFDVHETTQHTIYEFWRRLAKQPRVVRRRAFHPKRAPRPLA